VQTGLAVFHNHLVVDAIASIFPLGSASFVRLREQFWLTMMREAAIARRSTIFTFAPEASVTPGFPDRVREAVEGVGGELAFVRLTVPVAIQEQRIADPSRAGFGKLRSISLLRQLRDQFTACEAAMPEPDITLDTSEVEPSEAARCIGIKLGLAAKSSST
jgi:hypothetical protein